MPGINPARASSRASPARRFGSPIAAHRPTPPWPAGRSPCQPAGNARLGVAVPPIKAGRRSGAMPGPRSLTTNPSVLRKWRISTSIVPPLAACATALSTIAASATRSGVGSVDAIATSGALSEKSAPARAANSARSAMTSLASPRRSTGSRARVAASSRASCSIWVIVSLPRSTLSSRSESAS